MIVEQQAIAFNEQLGSCWECGYSLRGLTTPRCPECGRRFDPANESTMNMGQNPGRLAQRLMRPPGWRLHLLAAAAALLCLWAAAAPVRSGRFVDLITFAALRHRGWPWQNVRNAWLHFELPEGRFLMGALVWALVLLLWISRRAARGIVVGRLSKHQAAPLTYWRRWLTVPVIFGLTVLVCNTRLPVYLGFWVSKPWMDQAVREAAAKKNVSGANTARWIGIYPPYSDVNGRMITWSPSVSSVNVGGDGAFLYCDPSPPHDLPYQPSSSHMIPLGGNWYFYKLPE